MLWIFYWEICRINVLNFALKKAFIRISIATGQYWFNREKIRFKILKFFVLIFAMFLNLHKYYLFNTINYIVSKTTNFRVWCIFYHILKQHIYFGLFAHLPSAIFGFLISRLAYFLNFALYLPKILLPIIQCHQNINYLGLNSSLKFLVYCIVILL